MQKTVRSEPLSSKQHEFATIRETIEFYYQKGWTDGLPIIPPTEEEVYSFLECCGRSPSDVLGVELVRNRVVTAEKVAINAVMAGCKPEYMPVLIAAVEAILDDAFNLHGVTSSTGGRAILLLINGPVRNRLGFNSRGNLLGPGHRANATVGRAMRLIQINVFRGTPGVLDRSTLGHPGQYTFCIAEDEEASPWEPFHAARGFRQEDSAVTVFAALSPIQVSNPYGRRPEEVLTTLANALMLPGRGQVEAMVLFPGQLFHHIVTAGWSRKQVQEFLYQQTHRPAKEWARLAAMPHSQGEELGDQLVPAFDTPEGIHVIPAGADGGLEAAVICMTTAGTLLLGSTGAREGVLSQSVTHKIDMSRL